MKSASARLNRPSAKLRRAKCVAAVKLASRFLVQASGSERGAHVAMRHLPLACSFCTSNRGAGFEECVEITLADSPEFAGWFESADFSAGNHTLDVARSRFRYSAACRFVKIAAVVSPAACELAEFGVASVCGFLMALLAILIVPFP